MNEHKQLKFQKHKLNIKKDDGGRRGYGWGRSNTIESLTWEAVNFRGQDMDTADVSIMGFGGKKKKRNKTIHFLVVCF